MIRAGLLSVSDGRLRVHEGLAPEIEAQALGLTKALEATGEVIVIPARDIVHKSRMAVEESRYLGMRDIDALVINVPVFAFPNFSALAASVAHVPIIAISPVNGALPGLGGLQAATNMITQAGGKCEKVWGDIGEPETLKRVMCFLRAAYAQNRLRGQVYGLIGGRSIGMGSGQAPQDFWAYKFGVDVEHIDQSEIIRRALSADQAEVHTALRWLEDKCGAIAYGGKLTRESLARQIRCYIATRELVEEYTLDFIGVKCHYEMSEYNVTQCLSAAFFGDMYDWTGPRKPVMFACEADSDAALTMQLMHMISGKPAAFADFRFFDKSDGLFAFCNCGAMSTYYAGRSQIPDENLSKVTLKPVIQKYGGQGCHVQFIAHEGEATFGRLSRTLGEYKLTLFRGKIEEAPKEKLSQTSEAWPHMFVRVNADPMRLIDGYCSNHVHAVYGDYIDELVKFAGLADIKAEVLA